MHFFSDIDECQNKSGINCDQLCVNLPGSYFCDCNNGYKLNADGGTCDGKPPNFFYSCPITLSPVQFLWVLFRFVLGIRMTQKWNWILQSNFLPDPIDFIWKEVSGTDSQLTLNPDELPTHYTLPWVSLRVSTVFTLFKFLSFYCLCVVMYILYIFML